ncbi:hypothetical protein B0H19DRAFT_198108 [Mycena capillaripes]|nr:hypothetical protein B0H19DRAFT_198108 [Mycena capillaripes]
MSLSHLYFTQLPDIRNSWPESQPWHPQLRSLLLSDTEKNPISSYLVNPRIDLTHLRSLAATTQSREIIQVTSRALEHLQLRYLRTHHVEDLSNALGANLRSVHFFINVSLFTCMDEFFRACPHDCRLETITFHGSVRRIRRSSSISDLNDTIESALVHLHSLKIVEIRLCPVRGSQLSDQNVIVRGTLTSLERRGILRVTERGKELLFVNVFALTRIQDHLMCTMTGNSEYSILRHDPICFTL